MKGAARGLLVLPALFLVIFSSGCTVPGLNIEIPFLPDIFGGMNVKEQRHDVISIESLDMIPSATVRSGQSIRLRAVVKNLQAPEYKPVEDVEIELFNDCGMFVVSRDFCETNQPANSATTCTLRMHPQYTSVVQWKLVANEINVETPCKVGVLARYKYKTFSTASVTFINKAELERIVAEGRSFSETGTLSIGEGPVKPYIEVLGQPIVIDVSSTGTIVNQGSGIMSFWLENKGGGYIDMPDAASGNTDLGCTGALTGPNNKICLNIKSTTMAAGPTVESIQSIDGNAWKSLKECLQKHLSISGGLFSVNFIGKKTPEYPCSISLKDTSRIKQELTYQIEADVGYSYKFTKEATVTVQPKIKP